jgi:hypothetical protein
MFSSVSCFTADLTANSRQYGGFSLLLSMRTVATAVRAMCKHWGRVLRAIWIINPNLTFNYANKIKSSWAAVASGGTHQPMFQTPTPSASSGFWYDGEAVSLWNVRWLKQFDYAGSPRRFYWIRWRETLKTHEQVNFNFLIWIIFLL